MPPDHLTQLRDSTRDQITAAVESIATRARSYPAILGAMEQQRAALLTHVIDVLRDAVTTRTPADIAAVTAGVVDAVDALTRRQEPQP